MGISGREEDLAKALRCDGHREPSGTGPLGPVSLEVDARRGAGEGDPDCLVSVLRHRGVNRDFTLSGDRATFDL